MSTLDEITAFFMLIKKHLSTADRITLCKAVLLDLAELMDKNGVGGAAISLGYWIDKHIESKDH